MSMKKSINYECRDLLMSAGFSNVAHIEWQWTTLYICNP